MIISFEVEKKLIEEAKELLEQNGLQIQKTFDMWDASIWWIDGTLREYNTFMSQFDNLKENPIQCPNCGLYRTKQKGTVLKCNSCGKEAYQEEIE